MRWTSGGQAGIHSGRVYRESARFHVPAVPLLALSPLTWAPFPVTQWLLVGVAAAVQLTYGGNQSWYAILHRPPFPVSGSAPAWLLISLAVAAASILVARRCVRARQKPFAIIAVALADLLISPISWTHQWIWVLLIPPCSGAAHPAVLVFRRGPDVPRPVRLLLRESSLTIVTPYWWFSRGIPANVLDAVLPLWTSAALVVWAAPRGQRRAAADANRPVRYASR